MFRYVLNPSYHLSPSSKLTHLLQNESVLIQKIYTHFKKAPGTHKLGVLYVVDSVTRQWVEAARKAGQPPGSSAPDGTFAAGVNRVTELLPVLMGDIINTSPQDQKVRARYAFESAPPKLGGVDGETLIYIANSDSLEEPYD